MSATMPPEHQSRTFGEVDPWDRIDAMPDHRPLTSSEAAVFMTFGVSTVERMRIAGTGPDYFQAGMRVEGSKPRPVAGTNQAIRYFKQDIKAWFERNKVSSSMQAATLKGQTFATISDLALEAAYYLDQDGAVAGPVDQTPLRVVIERLGDWDIVWMPAVEAAARRWASLAEHRAFAESVKRALSRAIQSVDAGLEGTEIASEVAKP